MIRRYDARRGFTMIELLVVIAIIGLLVALLMPAIQAAREASRRTQCSNNMKQIGIGFHSFSEAMNGEFPSNSTLYRNPAATVWPFYALKSPFGSWNIKILPHVDGANLYDQYDINKDWWDNTGNNARISSTQLPLFNCPSTPNSGQRYLTTTNPAGFTFNAASSDYIGVGGMYDTAPGGPYYHRGAMQAKVSEAKARVADFTDGLSNTVCVVEICDKPNQWRLRTRFKDNSATIYTCGNCVNGQWAAPNWNDLRGYSYDGVTAFGTCAVNCSNSASVYSFHPGGAYVLMGDGAVRFLRAGLGRDVLLPLVSINEGDVPPSGW